MIVEEVHRCNNGCDAIAEVITPSGYVCRNCADDEADEHE